MPPRKKAATGKPKDGDAPAVKKTRRRKTDLPALRQRETVRREDGSFELTLPVRDGVFPVRVTDSAGRTVTVHTPPGGA